MRILGFLSFLLLTVQTLSAQMLDPIKWQVRAERVSDTEYDLVFTAVPESEEWHLYSQYTEPGGPLPTEFTFEDAASYSRVGKVEEESAIKSYASEVFGGVVVKEFEKGNVDFTQRLKVTDPSFPIEGYVSYMTCNATQCLPPKDYEFSVALAGIAAPGLPPGPTPTEPATPAPAAPELPVSTETTDPGATSGVAEVPAPTPPTPTPTVTPKEIPPVSAPKKAEPKPTTPPPATPSAVEEAPEKIPVEAPSANEEMLEPLVWSFDKEQLSATAYDLVYTITLAPGWHTYSQTTDDGGPLPTEFTFTSSEGVDVSAPVVEETPTKTKFEELFGVNVTEFAESPVVFRQRVTLTQPNATLKGYATAMACEEGRCLPPTLRSASAGAERWPGQRPP